MIFNQIVIIMKKTVLSLLALSLIALSMNAQKRESLFNGKDLSNWNFVVKDNALPAEDVFSVQDGVILVEGTLGFMYTKKQYSNYTLEVEWSWVEEATNSGIFIHIADPVEKGNAFPHAIECQLKAGNAGDFVLLGVSALVEFTIPSCYECPQFSAVANRGVRNDTRG